jgi:hypothetical protein
MTKATLASLAVIGLLAFVAAGCASSGGKPHVRVTEEKGYIQFNHIQDTSQSMALKKGAAMAMACSKCKTVWYDTVTPASSQFFYPPPLRGGIAGSLGWQQQRWAFHDSFHDWSQRHYCPGCKSTITTTGTRENTKETIKHTCHACGEESVDCCATQKDAPPTEGMEKK